ncbi:MAG: 16S rRNA (cytidine(1402)-2'-O)-methyltransferase [Minwuia sp.]|uniref:16S rRNA (cytidine(1402)-2'-O)-methyltransferase n=1 Tax=Minwuia sp. TaxID=2493630 RepID=UPI003A84AC73
MSNAADDRSPPRLSPGLYVVATPIGNLGDITDRARLVLSQCDLLLAEDRRFAARLLSHIGASVRIENYADHNAASVRPRILERLAAGAAIALTSDAGTPLISDPGYKLVDEAREAGVPVHAVPGPSAVTAALSVAGLPTDRFLFAGFLPPRQTARRRAIEEVRAVRATLVFYKSPKRLPGLLEDLHGVLGDRPAALARELTKLHEEVRRDGLAGLAEHYATVGPPKGEIVVLVGWTEPEAVDDAAIDRQLAELMQQMSPRDAVDRVAAETGAPRREVYQRALAIKDRDGQA